MAEKKVFDIAPSAPAPTVVTHANSPMVSEETAQAPEDSAVPVEVRREKVISPTVADQAEPKESSPTTEAPQKEISQEPQVESAAPAPREVQSVPKALDTTQYQLPIQRHSKATSGKMMLQFIAIFLFLGGIGVIIAIDAEILDLGIELPFDFL